HVSTLLTSLRDRVVSVKGGSAHARRAWRARAPMPPDADDGPTSPIGAWPGRFGGTSTRAHTRPGSAGPRRAHGRALRPPPCTPPPLARAPTTSHPSARGSQCLAREAGTAGLRPGSRRPASASGSAGPVRTASSSPSPHLPSGRRIGELLTYHLGGVPVALGQVFPPTGDLGGVDHASLQLVEVRQGDMGRRGVAGLPSDGRQEQGPGRGAQDESHGEEDASHPSPPPTTAISLTATSASCSQA